MLRRHFRLGLAAIMVFALLCAHVAHTQTTSDTKNPVSGTYTLDPDHSSVNFKISHLGFSRYTGRFDKLEGTLNLIAQSPEQSELDVTAFTNSIDTNNMKLQDDLRGDKWLNVIKYPRATFKTTRIERTGEKTAKITGDLTFLGVTHTLVLDATLVGFGENTFTNKAVVGFSATGTLARSSFGMSNMIPLIGDDVNLEIEAEFDKVN